MRIVPLSSTQCSGTALRALYQEAFCITATYVSHDTTAPATATVTAVQWAQPAQRGKTPTELPAEIPIIVLARKSHHSGPGPKLHQNIANLIPLRTAPACDGTPVLPQAQHIHLCGALTPAALHQSDALLLGKAPKVHSATCFGTPPVGAIMYLTDRRSQVLAKLRALISSSLQLIYQLRFNHDPPPVPIPRSRPYIPATPARKWQTEQANHSGRASPKNPTDDRRQHRRVAQPEHRET